MKVKIEIDTQTFVRFLLVATGFVAAIFIIFKIAPAITLICISFFLAIALNPPVTRLANHMPKGSRIGATAIAYLIVLIVLGVLIYVAVPPLIQQTNTFIDNLPRFIDNVKDQRGVVAGLIDRYGLEAQVDQFVASVQSQAGALAQGVGGSVVTGLTSALNGVITILTILVLTFLMLIEGPRWMERVWALYADPAKRERHHNLVHRLYRVVTGYVNGQVVVASIAGACALVTLLVLNAFFDVPTAVALPLAGIVALTGLIPMIGATIGATIVITVLLFNDISAALIFLIYFIIYQQIENNLIQPVIQSRSVELSALAVFSAIIIGITLFGILGGLIAIPVAGCMRVLMLDYIEHRQKQAKRRHVGKLAGKKA